ncbi:hypothetical protein Bbelb_391070 [Branchiostoma belcheri]|nr:hypothetical protein Bbelb_391070 [Branchiostoma belcheri]
MPDRSSWACGRDPTCAPPGCEKHALPCLSICRVPAGGRPMREPPGLLQPVTGRDQSPAGAGLGYIPDGHRRNFDRSFTGRPLIKGLSQEALRLQGFCSKPVKRSQLL